MRAQGLKRRITSSLRVCLTVWLSTPIRPVPGCPENPPNIKTKPPEISFYIRGGGGRFNITGKGINDVPTSRLGFKGFQKLATQIGRVCWVWDCGVWGALEALQSLD